jgi:hypothetical protein
MLQFVLLRNTLAQRRKVIAFSSLEPLSHPKINALSKIKLLFLLKVIALRT